MARPSTLPAPSHELVLNALQSATGPQTAYNLLENLKKFGINSPPIVYRALERLVERGAVHRIQALNAFVACNCSHDHEHALSVLTVCGQCRQVHELHDHAVIDHLNGLRALNVALAERGVIELPIVCPDCQGS